MPICPPLPAVEDAQPLGDGDERLVADLKDVLHRHGALNRLGIVLLHEHFPVHDDEVLVETNDPEARTLALHPLRLNELPAGLRLMQTSWRLDVDDPLHLVGGKCVTSCYVDLRDRHKRKHEQTPLQPNR